jgi:hypothetical protein
MLIDGIDEGGILFDRDGNLVADAITLQEKAQLQRNRSRSSLNSGDPEINREDLAKSEKSVDLEDVNLPKRNLYITYKAFPTGEKLATAVKWQES